MHQYTAPEIIAIIAALAAAITNVVFSIRGNSAGQANGRKLSQQANQLDRQDMQLKDIKEQTNGGYGRLQDELARVTRQVVQLESEAKTVKEAQARLDLLIEKRAVSPVHQVQIVPSVKQ